MKMWVEGPVTVDHLVELTGYLIGASAFIVVGWWKHKRKGK